MLWRNSRGRPVNAYAAFIHPCRPTVAKEPPCGPAWAHELKHDGYRLIQSIADRWAGRLSRYGTNRLAAAFILVAAVLLRLQNLNVSLWHDEVFYSTLFGADSLPKLWESALIEPPAPLYRLVLYGWVTLFGENEIVVRMPSLICGIAAILLTYAIAKKYSGTQAALLAALFLCFSPAHIWYSQEATPYAMTMCFLLAAVLVWHELKSDIRSGRWYFFYGLFLVCAIFTHYFAAVYLFPLTVLVLDAPSVARKRIIAINLFAGALVVGTITAKSLFGHLATANWFLRPFTLFEWWLVFFNWFLNGNSIWNLSPYRTTLQDLINSPLLIICQIFFCFILALGLLPRRGQGSHRQSLELLLFLIVLPVSMLLLTKAGYQKIYVERYLLIGLPFFAIVLARGAAEFSNRYMTGICFAAVVTLGVISYAMFLSKSDQWTVYKPKSDMLGAAKYLAEQNISADDAMIMSTKEMDLPFYIDQQAQNHPIVQDHYDAVKVDQEITAGKVKVIYAVRNRWAMNSQENYKSLQANQRLMLTATRSFKGVDVYTFVPR